jgi:peptidoglycan hydrolase CwlO-like protein
MAVPRRTQVLFVIAGIGLILSFSFFSLISSAKNEKKLRIQKEAELSQKLMELGELQKQITALNEEKEATTAELESKQKELNEVQKKLHDLEDQLETQSQQFEEAKATNANLANELNASKASIETLTKKIRNLESDRANLQDTINHYEEERASQTKEAEMKKAADEEPAPVQNEEEIIQSFDTVKLGKIVVQKESGKAVRVQMVNPMYGFIIVNAGKRDGLAKNTVINIVRNNKIIGKAVVEKLKDNTAAAVTMPEWNKDDIKVGDMISRF